MPGVPINRRREEVKPICEKATPLSPESVVQLFNEYSGKAAGTMPFRPKAGGVYMFKGNSLSSNDWKADGYLWAKEGGLKPVPTAPHLKQCKFNILIKESHLGCKKIFDTRFKKMVFLQDAKKKCGFLALIHYISDMPPLSDCSGSEYLSGSEDTDMTETVGGDKAPGSCKPIRVSFAPSFCNSVKEIPTNQDPCEPVRAPLSPRGFSKHIQCDELELLYKKRSKQEGKAKKPQKQPSALQFLLQQQEQQQTEIQEKQQQLQCHQSNQQQQQKMKMQPLKYHCQWQLHNQPYNSSDSLCSNSPDPLCNKSLESMYNNSPNSMYTSQKSMPYSQVGGSCDTMSQCQGHSHNNGNQHFYCTGNNPSFLGKIISCPDVSIDEVNHVKMCVFNYYSVCVFVVVVAMLLVLV